MSIENGRANTRQSLPPYVLLELIGKGSFERVYKANAVKTGEIVAIKIINIDQGDRLALGMTDTFNDIPTEVSTPKLLSANGTENIITILDALLVDYSRWMITEYCAGGSVATLRRPTGGLPEKRIIPILHDVAEAIYWVHKQGIFHRDSYYSTTAQLVLFNISNGSRYCYLTESSLLIYCNGESPCLQPGVGSRSPRIP